MDATIWLAVMLLATWAVVFKLILNDRRDKVIIRDLRVRHQNTLRHYSNLDAELQKSTRELAAARADAARTLQLHNATVARIAETQRRLAQAESDRDAARQQLVAMDHALKVAGWCRADDSAKGGA